MCDFVKMELELQQHEASQHQYSWNRQTSQYDDCREVVIPPPEPFRRKSYKPTAEFTREQLWQTIRSYRAAAGQDIIRTESARWACPPSDKLQCAVKTAQFLLQKRQDVTCSQPEFTTSSSSVEPFNIPA